jgi:hypothetical protein
MNSDETFGGVAVIISDPAQLSPVAGKSVWDKHQGQPHDNNGKDGRLATYNVLDPGAKHDGMNGTPPYSSEFSRTLSVANWRSPLGLPLRGFPELPLGYRYHDGVESWPIPRLPDPMRATNDATVVLRL